MYDMPEDEILGFWGKRPFLANRIPRRTEPPESKPVEFPASQQLPAESSFEEPETPQLHSSWRTDPTLLRYSYATSEIAPQA